MPALGMKLDGLPTEEIPPLSAAIEEHGLDEVCSEVTEATRRLLAGETVTLHGEWVHLDEVTLHFPAYVSEVVARLGRPAHRITVFSGSPSTTPPGPPATACETRSPARSPGLHASAARPPQRTRAN